MLSVIFVRVRSLFTGRKFFTPEMRFSKFAPKPRGREPSFRRSVSLLLREEKPRKRSEDWLGREAGACVGAEVIIVMRVISRTLHVVSLKYPSGVRKMRTIPFYVSESSDVSAGFC